MNSTAAVAATTPADSPLGIMDRVDGLAVYSKGSHTDTATATIVLVHAASERAARFSRLVPHLDDFDVVTFDRRGFGDSVPGASKTVDECVDDIKSTVDHAARMFGRKPILVAQCWGAALSLAYAERNPDDLEGAGFWEPLSIRQFWDGINLETAIAGGGMSGRDMVLARFGGEPGFAALPQEKQDLLLRYVEGVEAEGRLVIGDRPFDDITTLELPCLVGVGRETDFIGASESSAWFASQLRNSMLVDIPSTGHSVHWTHPFSYAHFVRMVAAHTASNRKLQHMVA